MRPIDITTSTIVLVLSRTSKNPRGVIEDITYQPNSPMGLDLKLLVPERLNFRASSGQFLGSALQGCSVDRCVRLLLLGGGRRNLGL